MLDDLPEVGLAAVLALLLVIGAWGAWNRRSHAAAWLRQGSRISGGQARLIVILVAAATFALVAEDIVRRETDEPVVRLDQHVRTAARAFASKPGVRATASILSRLTGEGVLVGVLAAGAGLLVTRRRRDALVLLGGTLGAWLLHGALKLAFRVPRPGAPKTDYAISGYGFPSGHTLVTVAACGLLAWVLGRRTSPNIRLALYAGAATLAGLAGAARVIQGAHWLSDVVAGLAVGVIWLNLVILFAQQALKAERGGRPADSAQQPSD